MSFESVSLVFKICIYRDYIKLLNLFELVMSEIIVLMFVRVCINIFEFSRFLLFLNIL